jgi:MFS family permease
MVPLALIVSIALTPLFDTINADVVTRIGFQSISACVGVAGTIAGMLLFFGMLAYLLLLDRSSWKIAWLILFLFTACFGSSIYFFAVYRKQLVSKIVSPEIEEPNKKSRLRELLCDRRAYMLFQYFAWCMVPMALMVLIALTPLYDTITASVAIWIVSGCILVLGTLAGIVLLLGMLAYLFLLDRSSWKLGWLIVFLFTSSFGSSIYFFVVYRRQVVPQIT